jgi:hypothetical protein
MCTFNMCIVPVHLWVKESTTGHYLDPPQQTYWKAHMDFGCGPHKPQCVGDPDLRVPH